MKNKDVTILMGDFNAKIGSINRGFEETMGQQGLGIVNENGELFLYMCAFNRMVIGGSIFPHKRIHKATWVSPDHKTENQIDHVCINQKFRRSLQDVRVLRGANAASDHHLVLAKLKLKLKKSWSPLNTRVKYNVTALKNQEKLEQFRITISNKYEILQDLLEDENMPVNDKWNHVKEALNTTCAEVLGKKTFHQKDWISVDTMNKVQERKKAKQVLNVIKTRAAKSKAQMRYTEVHKEVKRSIRSD